MDNSFRWARSLKTIKENAQQLTAIYLLSLFSNRSIDKKDAGDAFMLWRSLRRQIWIARSQVYLSNIRDRIVSIFSVSK
jgi:hypothetical protein